ncbi:hypothetical protein [Ottowia sp.]|uniref:hypothetical protein n=1 Tax=Ottowia sp. TaxID=1898956 RepID=UPI003A876181
MTHYLPTIGIVLLTAIAVAHLLPVLGILTVRLLARNTDAAAKELAALPDVSDHDKAAALACIKRAKTQEDKTLWADALAPVVCAYALPFTPRGADKLPAWASRWDNNVSLNGDGHGVLRDGQWIDRKDIGADGLLPGEVWVSYSDPAYGGGSYYAKGHHPRSLWARWVWVGWRNRASALSVSLGTDVAARPMVISGAADVGRSKPGHMLLKCGDVYHLKTFANVGPLCVIRSVGAKLEYALYRDPDESGSFGRVPYVVIGISFKIGAWFKAWRGQA